MPGERDGLALAEAVHRERPDVRLIITSGRAQPAPADIPDNGQFIGKPYNLEASPEIIRAMPNKASARRSRTGNDWCLMRR